MQTWEMLLVEALYPFVMYAEFFFFYHYFGLKAGASSHRPCPHYHPPSDMLQTLATVVHVTLTRGASLLFGPVCVCARVQPSCACGRRTWRCT
jgi:hypothetical protein